MADVFENCQDIFDSDKPQFLSLLENYIDLDEIIPFSFRNHFYALTGRSHKSPLNALLWELIIQRIFSIPTDSLLLVFLNYSKELREFCGFSKVPDASKITRFKQDFLSDLQSVFDNLVDVTEPICQAVDSFKADMTIFDSSGIEAFVQENNSKYANRIITNGLGIVRHISFYNKDFLTDYPEIIVEKKSDSPDEDKSVHDARLLILTLSDFFNKHPLIEPRTFLGDSAFDSISVYEALLSNGSFDDGKHFSKAYIPLNERSKLKNSDCTINHDGIPCCPNDPTLPMKPEENAMLSHGSLRYKFICPKMKWVYDKTTKKMASVFLCDSPQIDLSFILL